MEEDKVDKTKPYYAKDEEKRIILYDAVRIYDEKYSAVDICFICDATASMDQYMETIKKTLISFLEEVKLQISVKPRVAFIAFRDRDGDQVELKDFTTDYDGMVEFIENIDCMGGDDPCEDVVAGLKEALKLDWSSDLNYVYLIADSPPHGKSYHGDNIEDDYPDDDKTKPLEKIAAHYRKAKINLVILKFNDTIDKMIEVIEKYYESKFNELKVIDIKKDAFTKEDFTKYFLDSLSKEMSASLAASRGKDFKWIKRTYEEPVGPDADEDMKVGTQFKGIIHTGFITGLAPDNKEYSYKLKLNKPCVKSCHITTATVSVGMFSGCYRLEVEGDSNYVAKIPKVPVEKTEDLLPDIEGTLITKHFASKFNKLLEEAEKREAEKREAVKEKEVKNKKEEELANLKTIQVLLMVIIKNTSSDDSTDLHVKRKRIFTAQKFLEGEYIKYNNNYGWKRQDQDSDNLLAQAFSHFTYEWSMGLMMVVDIQGVVEENELKITDPAIHSYILENRFGETNHGKIGMMKFFKTHVCNDYCRKLDLMDPKTFDKIDKSKVDKAKEKYKGEVKLKHLYKEFKIDLEVWKKRIQFFDESLDPDSELTENIFEEVIGG